MSEQDPEHWLTGLYHEHGSAVHNYARRRVDSAEDAEDVVVEVFATAWRRRADVPEQPLPWLYATAGHVVAHVARGQSRRQRLGARLAVIRPAGTGGDDPADQVVDAAVARDVVAQAMAAMPSADAELLRLWAWEHLEPAEIADVLGMTPGSVRTRLHRARARMRDSLRACGMAGPWDDAAHEGQTADRLCAGGGGAEE